MVLPFLEKRKFVLVIGDDGAILSFFNGKKVEKRLFAISASLSDRSEMNALFNKYPSVPVYMLLDTMEQSYTKQTLPAVSPLAIGKLVKKRLERDFAESDLKGSVMFGRDPEGRKDWIYMFAAAPMTHDLQEWIDYIFSLDNRFAGIYMLPVEMGNFVKSLRRGKKSDSNWTFIITHNKTGGFRQVILQGDKVVFTRLIRQGKENIPDIIAGNIEQEAINTIDYLRRLSLGDEDAVDVIAVVSSDIKKSLEGTVLRGKEIELYTPYEASRIMKLAGVASEDDKFSDVLISANFIFSRPVLKLENPSISEVNTLVSVYNFSNIAVAGIVPLLLIYEMIIGYSIYSVSGDIKDVETRKAAIEKEWRDARKSDQYNIDDANKIADFASLHETLSSAISPMTIIADIADAQRQYANTRSLSWNYMRVIDDKKAGNLEAIFNMEFYNSGNSIEDLFANYDGFTAGIRQKLQEYNLEISELPRQVTFDERKDVIAVKVKAVKAVSEKSNNDT